MPVNGYFWTRLIVCGVFLLHVSANDVDLTNRGTRFVVACPWLEMGDTCEARITTTFKDWVIVEVRTGTPNSPVLEKHTVFPGKTAIVELFEGMSESPLKDGAYSAKSLMTTRPVHAVVFSYMRHRSGNIGDAFVLIPESSCHKTFYTNTPRGFPFLSVMSFNHTSTTLDIVSISKCDVGDPCPVMKPVRVTLTKHQHWYMNYENYSIATESILIIANHPVFVITGSNQFENNDQMLRKTEFRVTTLKPILCWGTSYIVHTTVQVTTFRFGFYRNTNDATITIHRDGRKMLMPAKYNKIGFTFYFKGKTLAFTCDIPFGLYQEFAPVNGTWNVHSLGDTSLLSLIPVEKWLDAVVYTDFRLPRGFTAKYLLMTQVEHKDIVIPHFKGEIIWYDSTITLGGKTYQAGELNLAGISTKIRTKKPDGRLMMYLELSAINDVESGFMSFPYDFYHGKTVHLLDCDGSEQNDNLSNIISNEGADNDTEDCAILAYHDNDNDDDLFPNENAQWEEWIDLCEIECEEEKLSLRIRSCLISTFGELCQGEALQCNEGTCPSHCGNRSMSESDRECLCNEGIGTRVYSNSPQCGSCEEVELIPGNPTVIACALPCPERWGAFSCNSLLVGRNGKIQAKEQGSRIMLMPLFISILMFLFVIGVLCHKINKREEIKAALEDYALQYNENGNGQGRDRNLGTPV